MHILLGLADSNGWCEGKAGSLTDLNVATGSSYDYDAKAKKLYLKTVSAGLGMGGAGGPTGILRLFSVLPNG